MSPISKSNISFQDIYKFVVQCKPKTRKIVIDKLQKTTGNVMTFSLLCSISPTHPLYSLYPHTDTLLFYFTHTSTLLSPSLSLSIPTQTLSCFILPTHPLYSLPPFLSLSPHRQSLVLFYPHIHSTLSIPFSLYPHTNSLLFYFTHTPTLSPSSVYLHTPILSPSLSSSL